MSLINKLLQDLEQRQASTGYEPISGEVRSVMKERTRTGWLMLFALVVPLMAGALLWMLTSSRMDSATGVTTPARSAAATPPAPARAAPAVVAVAPTAKALDPQPAPVAAAKAPEPAPAPVVVAKAPEPKPVPKVAAKAAPEPKPAPAVVAKAAEPKPKPVPATKAPEPKPAEAVAATADVKSVAMTGVVKKPPTVVEQAAPEAVEKPQARMAVMEAQSQKTVSPHQLSDNLYKKAVALTQQGQPKDARKLLAESLSAEPRNAPARQLLVSLLVEANFLNEASALLREGVKLSPEHSGLWMQLARLQLENADATGATLTLEQGLPAAEEDAPYHAFYAALMQRAGRHDDAVKHYLAALRVEPGMPNWLVGIGISLQALGRETDAAEAFQRAKDGGQLPPAFIAFVDQRLNQLKR